MSRSTWMCESDPTLSFCHELDSRHYLLRFSRRFNRAMSQPTINSSRLLLRPFELSDAPDVKRLAGEHDVADTTLNIPHPYEDGMAEEWIASHKPEYEAGSVATFAIVLRDDLQLIGAIGLTLDREINRGELGYWIAKPAWNSGYATEATTAVLEYGFGELELNRIAARHLVRNPASGRVMEKAGMTREGTARQDTMRWGKYEDLVFYGILREDWCGKGVLPR